MNGNVWNSLINLCVDICRRNGKNKLLWLGSATATLNYAPKSNEMVLSAHRWFKNKACPGDWLYSRFGTLASEVTKRLGGSGSSTISAQPAPAASKPAAGEFQVQVNITDLNIRKGPGTNYAKTGKKTGKGTFTITQTSSGAGSSAGWGKLKSGAGWISLDYAKRVGSTSTSSTAKPAAAASSSYKTWVGKVTATRLNVRTGAGTNYGNLSSYPILGKNNLVDVIGTAKDNKGATWYKIRIANKYVGYVHSSYLTKA